MRAHRGLAWFPCLAGDTLAWEADPRYPRRRELVRKPPAGYRALGLRAGMPIWRQYRERPEAVMRVPQPTRVDWAGFIP